MTNAAAIGYMIIAAKARGLDKETIEEIESSMRYAMDQHTEDEAEREYWNF